MSPFSLHLKALRLAHGYKRQNVFAFFLGYEPSYVSALERSEKGPPRQDFINRLIAKLKLTHAEQEELYLALNQSRRQLVLPAKASSAEYELVRLLEPRLGQLHPLQIELIKLALRIPVGSQA